MKKEFSISIQLCGPENVYTHQADHITRELSGYTSKQSGIEPYYFHHGREFMTVKGHTLLDEKVLFTIISDIMQPMEGVSVWILSRRDNLEEKKEVFAALLEAYDWTYMRSDDPSAYKRGYDQEIVINRFLQVNTNPIFKQMYAEANPFNNNKTII